jgi:hypothetical protein
MRSCATSATPWPASSSAWCTPRTWSPTWSGSATTSSCWSPRGVQVAGEVSELLARHRLLTAPGIDPAALPAGLHAVSVRHSGPQDTAVVRCDAPAGPGSVPAGPGALSPVGLEDLVLAYMSQSAPALEVAR